MDINPTSAGFIQGGVHFAEGGMTDVYFILLVYIKTLFRAVQLIKVKDTFSTLRVPATLLHLQGGLCPAAPLSEPHHPRRVG